jgi:hypothetical protein
MDESVVLHINGVEYTVWTQGKHAQTVEMELRQRVRKMVAGESDREIEVFTVCTPDGNDYVDLFVAPKAVATAMVVRTELPTAKVF